MVNKFPLFTINSHMFWLLYQSHCQVILLQRILRKPSLHCLKFSVVGKYHTQRDDNDGGDYYYYYHRHCYSPFCMVFAVMYLKQTLQFLNIVLSQYVAQVLSDCEVVPYAPVYWYRFCFCFPRAVHFYCKVCIL